MRSPGSPAAGAARRGGDQHRRTRAGARQLAHDRRALDADAQSGTSVLASARQRGSRTGPRPRGFDGGEAPRHEHSRSRTAVRRAGCARPRGSVAGANRRCPRTCRGRGGAHSCAKGAIGAILPVADRRGTRSPRRGCRRSRHGMAVAGGLLRARGNVSGRVVRRHPGADGLALPGAREAPDRHSTPTGNRLPHRCSSH